MKTISLTVPMDYNALTRASDMLHGMAIDLKHEGAPTKETVKDLGQAIEEEQPAATVEQITEAEVNSGNLEPAATEVFAAPNADTVANATEQPAESATTAEPVTTAAAPAGVEVDSDGLPWDHRIHALGAGGAHNKLKKTQQWKKKRGVDAVLVAEVEAELRAAMFASPANPVDSTPAPAPAAQETPAIPANPAPATHGTVDTFPELMAAITANAIDQAAVTAAVNAQGLQALPLLAARPDLIPAVAAALGV